MKSVSVNDAAERSLAKITDDHLCRLRDLTFSALASLFARRTYSGQFANCLQVVCLAQGAAQHRIDGTSGVKDFDVWCFFEKVGSQVFPSRYVGHADFGESEFGRHPHDPGYEGRRIDILGRSIEFRGEKEPSVRRWLMGSSASAMALRRKAVIGLWPEELFATQVWP